MKPAQFKLKSGVASLFLLNMVFPPIAYAVSLGDQPTVTTSAAKPNIMFTLDNSGSMDWDFLPDDVDDRYSYAHPVRMSPQTNGIYYNPAVTYTPPKYSNNTSMPSMNSANTSAWTAVPENGFAKYPNATPGTAATSGFTNRDLVSNFPSSMGSGGSGRALRWYSSPTPTVTTNVTHSNSAFPGSPTNYPNVTYKYRPAFTTTTSTASVGPYYYIAKNDTPADQRIQWCTQSNSVTQSSVSQSGCVIGDPFPNAYIKLSTEFQRVDIRSTTTSYTYTAPFCEYFDSADSTWKLSITGANCPTITRTYEQEMENFANWFAYYRTRIQTMKTALGSALSGLDQDPTTSSDFRIGFYTINSGSSNFLDVKEFTRGGNGQPANREAFFNKFYSISPSGGTPLRNAAWQIGEYFRISKLGNTNKTDPIQYSCQKNFHILSSDGYWNESTTISSPTIDTTVDATMPAGGLPLDSNGNPPASMPTSGNWPRPFYDAGGSVAGGGPSLADIAMYYWSTDLRTGSCTVCANNVPPANSTSAITGYAINPATWQHVAFYGLAFGVTGNLLVPTLAGSGDLPALRAGTKSWPATLDNLQPGTIDDFWHATINGHGEFFSASDPAALTNSINSIFTSITGQLTASGFAVPSPVTSGDASVVFQNWFDPGKNWMGDVIAYAVDPLTLTPAVTQSGTTKPPVWYTSAKLDDLVRNGGTMDGWNSKRKIFTRSAGAPVPFRWVNLDATQQTALKSENLVNYLRGDIANEGTTFRERGVPSVPANNTTDPLGLLGDVVNSEARVVGKPIYNFSDNGYRSFVAAKTGRTPMMYIGANDGMLHAFNIDASYQYYQNKDSSTGLACATVGGTCVANPVSFCDLGTIGCWVDVSANANSGVEMWAYVPSMLIRNNASGLASLANKTTGSPAFKHYYYVDGVTTTMDVDFDRAGNAAGTGAPDWRTILVGGLNKGGPGFYALDVTDGASNASSETTVAGKSLWEFTDGSSMTAASKMGFSFGNPIIMKTRSFGWTVFLTSGYFDTTSSMSPSDGKGRLYLVNPKTGALLHTFVTATGSTANPIELGKITAHKLSDSDFTAEQIYGVDLQGNMWRFDVSGTLSASGTTTVTTPFASFVSPSTGGQPMTTQPWISIDPTSNIRVINVGTGKYLHSSDISSSQQQSTYHIVDGTGRTPGASGATITRANLKPVSNTNTASFTLSASEKGWYRDLDAASGLNGAERVIVDPVGADGIIIFNANVPTTDACSPAMSTNTYANYALSGGSVLANAAGTTLLPRETTTQNRGKPVIVRTLADPTKAANVNPGNKKVVSVNSAGGLTVTAIPAPRKPTRFGWRELTD